MINNALDALLCLFCVFMDLVITHWGWIVCAIVYMALASGLAVIIGRAAKGN